MILKPFGVEYTFALKSQMMGRKAIDACRFLVKETGIPLTAEQFLEQREVELDKLFPNCHILPGVEKLVTHLHKHGIPMAVATGSHTRHFKMKTSKHGHLFSLFHHVVTGDDSELKQAKPSPDIFLIAMNRFDPPVPASTRNVLVFEDAPLGVQAAINADMPVVMIPEPRASEEDRKKATVSFTSLELFKPELFGLPPYPEDETTATAAGQ